MKRESTYLLTKVAPLIWGAISLFSCAGRGVVNEVDTETLMTQQSDTLTLINSTNGALQYRFHTPLMERYELAREPYMEFRYGVDVTAYDTLGTVSSTLVADYAIFYEKRKLWEARGNVEVCGQGGKQLFTQQLFWDQVTDKIYSNVDSKVVDGDDTFIGDGFESDSQFDKWEFRNAEGRIMVDVSKHMGNGNDADTDRTPTVVPAPRGMSSKEFNAEARRQQGADNEALRRKAMDDEAARQKAENRKKDND